MHMLLRLGVENHLSIRERQELALGASALKDTDEGLIACEAVHGGAVVPAVLVYGANGSGKTSLLRAASSMKARVLGSQAGAGPDGGAPRTTFLLDPAWSRKPSGLDIDIVVDGTRYHYGFETRDRVVTSEWLYGFPKAHGRKLFERDGQDFEFGRWLTGQTRGISRLTRPDSAVPVNRRSCRARPALPGARVLRQHGLHRPSGPGVPRSSGRGLAGHPGDRFPEVHRCRDCRAPHQ